MKLGALGVPTYRSFSLKDIEDATNNFDTSTLLNEGSYSQNSFKKISQVAALYMLLSFIPPDGSFDLITCRLSTQVKRLIWVEVQVKRHSRSLMEIMVKARSQFKERRQVNVEVKNSLHRLLDVYVFFFIS